MVDKRKRAAAQETADAKKEVRVGGIPKKIRDEIEAAIILRAKAKMMETEAKLMSASAKETLLPLLAAYGLSSYPLAGVGTAIIKISKGSSIDVSKLRENMLVAGIDIKVMDDVIERATKSWSTEYVEFKEEK